MILYQKLLSCQYMSLLSCEKPTQNYNFFRISPNFIIVLFFHNTSLRQVADCPMQAIETDYRQNGLLFQEKRKEWHILHVFHEKMVFFHGK